MNVMTNITVILMNDVCLVFHKSISFILYLCIDRCCEQVTNMLLWSILYKN
ncbi:unnamed protein product [Schistosoma curassoni]|uniref:Uncharacterized protein n=1 Tax=Schistosoma curassoni TaxID=6186 RepID=A0A183K7Y5_9TREM|nr:unnamed protein product [Schistosoma curassoni]